MDDLMFYKGWALLTAQPYAAFLAYDETKMQLQEGMFQRATAGYDGLRWLQVVERWILKETEWPKLPEILSMLKNARPPALASPALPDLTASRGGPAPDDYLPRRLYQREGTALAGASIWEAAMILIPDWLKTAHRGDPDYARAERFLALARVEAAKGSRCDHDMPSA